MQGNGPFYLPPGATPKASGGRALVRSRFGEADPGGADRRSCRGHHEPDNACQGRRDLSGVRLPRAAERAQMTGSPHLLPRRARASGASRPERGAGRAGARSAAEPP
jgi:hypothetical protein